MRTTPRLYFPLVSSFRSSALVMEPVEESAAETAQIPIDPSSEVHERRKKVGLAPVLGSTFWCDCSAGSSLTMAGPLAPCPAMRTILL